jgi:hypothetical protein
VNTEAKMNGSTIANIALRKLFLSALMLTVSLVPGESKARNASSSNPQRASSERSPNMKINITIGGKLLTATLVDNETARDFVSLLPLSVSINDLFGREKYGNLPKALLENGPRSNRYEVGEIAYWSPDHQVAVYYRQDGKSIPSPGVIIIAKIDAGAEAFNVLGSVKVNIDVSK